MPKPSDVVAQAVDHTADVLANISAQADRPSTKAQDRETLEKQYDDLFNDYRRLLFKQLKKLDKDPRIKDQITELEAFTLELGSIKKEMVTATKTIDAATKAINIVGSILVVVARAL